MSDDDLSRQLRQASRGEVGALEALARSVHEELRGLAAGLMRAERAEHTLQPTALVNEAWLRLQPRFGVDFSLADRRAFFGAAAQAMRRLLVDHARDRRRVKRGAGRERVELDAVVHGLHGELMDAGQLIDLDQALRELARVNPRAARIIELHVFSGLSQSEVAGCLEVSLGTVQLDWRASRAWLRQHLERGHEA
jgi:RNA polymerase sigma factor (TIGR02999 family)